MKQKKKTFKTNKNKKKEATEKHVKFKLAGRDFFLIACFVLFTTLLFFYSGDGVYFKLFAFSNPFENSKTIEKTPNKFIVPYVINTQIIPSITATSVYVIDLDSATPLYAKDQHARLFPASTTKIITALTAMKFFKLDKILTVKRVITEGQVAGLVVGERLTFENILYALLVHSGNDAAYVVADNFPGGYDKFIIQMNEVTKELHMANSRFTNPAGLDATGQYISAFDLSLAARKLLENKELSRIVSTKSITISDVGFTNFHSLTNVNKLLGEIPGLGGLKTGYTENAGENLVSFYTHGGRRYVIVILKSEDRFEDTKNIIQWIITNVAYKQFVI